MPESIARDHLRARDAQALTWSAGSTHRSTYASCIFAESQPPRLLVASNFESRTSCASPICISNVRNNKDSALKKRRGIKGGECNALIE